MGTLVDYFNRGGTMMWLLLLVAILAVAITLERIYTLFIKIRTNPRKFLKRVKLMLDEGNIEELRNFLAAHKSPLAKVLLEGLDRVDRGRVVVEEAMTRKAASEFAFLDRGMIYLSASATVAPILGFLGTVTGMIKAFQAIALAGEVEPTLVAAGISEALITTATGLLIAAPVAVVYAAFMARVNNYGRQVEEVSNEFIELLLEKGLVKEAL
jgi:biopolymer transport protein ExbB